MQDEDFFDSAVKDARGRMGKISYVSAILGALEFMEIYKKILLGRVAEVTDHDVVAGVAEHVGALDVTKDSLMSLLREVDTFSKMGGLDRPEGPMN